jgi:nucleoid-associated protein YgaU
MKRWPLLLVGIAVLFVAGCEQKKPQTEMQPDLKPTPVARTEPAVETDPYATDPMLTQPKSPAYTPAPKTAPPEPKHSTAKSSKAATGGRTHVVAKGETLSSIAKKYYGDANDWKKIWEANKSVVPDPKKLKVGTKLTIP